MNEIFVTADDIKKLDLICEQRFGIPVETLMENAGRAVALKTIEWINKNKFSIKKIAVICGSGNNGGDGLVSARYLNKNFSVDVFLTRPQDQLKDLPKINLEKIKKLNIPVIDDINFENYDLLIDAILGVGTKERLKQETEDLIKKINNSNKPIISIDLPSGMNSDTGEILGACIKSNLTVTLGFPKKGFQNPSAKDFLGELVVVDIGYPKNIILL